MSDDPKDATKESAIADNGDTAKRAGRGGLAIAVAKIFFIIIGLAQQIILKHVMGLQAYGTLGRIQSLGSMVYNPVVQTGVQGVSRAVSATSDADRPAATRTALSVHMLAVLPLAGAFIALAPVIASLVSAPHLTTGLRLIGGVLLLYGLYAPLVGVLNGRQRFGMQALLDGTFAILRTIGLVAGGYLLAKSGRAAEGALGGFLIAIVVIIAFTAPIAGLGKRHRGSSPPLRFADHLRFVLPLWAGQLALNFLFQIDLTLLGKFATESAVTAGLTGKEGDVLAGAYRNAQLFCFLPYQLLLSVTFVLFPMLAQAKRDDDHEAIKEYVARGLRLALILAGAMVSVTASIPGELLTLVFGADSASIAAGPMVVLSLGLGVFAFFGILATVLTSLGGERISAAITVAALACVSVLCFLLVRGQPYGSVLLFRTALATAGAMVFATALAAFFVRRAAGGLVGIASVVRVALGVAACVLLGRYLPGSGKLFTIIHALLLGLAYLVILVVTRELRAADVQLIKTALRGKKKA